MARIVTHNGVRHSFPDEATDEQITSALDGSDIGTVVGDKRRVSDAQILDMLKAQLADPERDPQATAELQREIQNYEKRIGATPVLHVTPAPRLAQADVRKSEPQPDPLAVQKEREDNFERAQKQFIAAGGVLKPNQTTRQATEEASGFQDPMKTRDAAEMAHIAEGGNVSDITGDSVAYGAAKTGAAVLGGGAGGPAGATAAEAVVRATALAYNLTRAVNAGSIDADDAYGILLKETAKGMGEDAMFNFGVPLLGRIAMKIPGATWLADRAKAGIAKGAQALGITSSAPAAAAAPSARDVKLADRAALTDDPTKQKAVLELGKRLPDDQIMTPGQVTGEPGIWESNVRRGSQRPFDRLDREMEKSADDMLRETTTPASQMSREDLGNVIIDTAKKTQAAMKTRLRPVFDEADALGIHVDMTPTRQIVAEELAKDAKVPMGAMNAKEREELNGIADFLQKDPLVSPEAALDFISRRKEVLRSNTADWAPSERFNTITGKLIKSVEDSYRQSALISGQPEVARNLLRAQKEYRTTMETVYEDAIKKALRSNAEDVGHSIWLNGNVSEVRQVHKLLALAEKEGVVGNAGTQKIKGDLARGFLQGGAKNVEAAANWSQSLKESTAKRETWDILTRGPDGQALRNTMEVIEQAAQMALKKNITLAGGTALAQRAQSGAMGVTSSSVHVGPLAFGLSLVGATKLAATAYTHGDKGMLNTIASLLRSEGSGVAGSRAAKAAYAKLAQYAAEHSIKLDETEEE